MLGLPVSSTAKVIYARLLDAALAAGAEDANGILFARCPIAELAGALGRSAQTQKRALRELEDAGLLLRVRQGFGEPNKIYVLIPRDTQKQDCTKTGLQAGRRAGIMEKSDLPRPARREAARGVAREHCKQSK